MKSGGARIVRVLLVFACAIDVTTAQSQDTFRQAVVVTAAATPVELGSATRAVSIVTREQIAALPLRSVADLLRLVSSVDVRSRGERGMQTDFSIRGGGFGQTLVLVDGVRLNDTQTGHHNGDIPVPLNGIERVEVLHGGGASLFGADAVGGTINIITRREAPSSVSVEAGSFDLVASRAQTTFGRASLRTMVSASFDRSSGFMTERQFVTGSFSSRTAIGSRATVGVSHVSKDFGANGFYGAAPSHEWTHQTLVSAGGTLGSLAGWSVQGVGSYRTHGDRFVFDVRRPALSDSRHRSHATLGTVKASRTLDARANLTVGIEGNADWLRSTNLGSHQTTRISAFGELRYAVAGNLQFDGSLRVDRYQEFGGSVNPGGGVSWWPADRVRLRASGGRAFRAPTFTERFYNDPANQARPEVGPERSWSVDGGMDLIVGAEWLVQAGVFGRRDQGVIDWLRATPADLWRTFNVHQARAAGAELSLRRVWTNGSFIQGGYTRTDVSAATLSGLCGAPTCLSKYVLDYAPHVLVGAAMVRLPSDVRLAPRLEYKRRQRNMVSSDYAILDLRVSRAFRTVELRLEGTNLGNATYQEVTGIAMPGRAGTVTVAITR
jgi:iron complex outermembrane receptor protein